jgi:PAS domain S-box-containing protein
MTGVHSQDRASVESLLDSAPDAMVGVDASGAILFVNRQIELLFGYPREQLIGRSVDLLVPEAFQAVHPDHRAAYVARPTTRAMGAGLELSGRRQDGSEFPVDISLSAIETEHGLLVTAAVRDVTERHKVDAKFEGLLEAAPDAMVGVDRLGTIRFVNRQTELMFGYGREELVGQTIETLVPESFRGVHPGHRSTYFARPATRAMGAGLDLSGRRKDGSEFPVDISLSSIETEHGPLVTAAVRDITDRRKAEQDLHRMAAIIESSDDAVVSKTLDGVITSWNPAAERLYGWTAEEAEGMPASFLVPPGQDDDVVEILARVTRGERVEHYETRRINKDGRVIDVSVAASPIRDVHGKLVGASTIARDITERKRAEATIRELNAELEHRVEQRTAELAEAVEDLEGFSYSVSHDLRAPLRAIDGFSRIVLEEYGGVLDAEGLRLLGIVRQATTDMSQLIDDLLAFSRVGRHQVQLSPVDMRELMTAVVTELLSADGAHEVEAVVHELPPARGDRALVRQVLVNLLSNAVKFSASADKPHIEVSGSVDGDHCTYWVTDNGVGFDKQYEDKLFQVFQRLHPNQFEGTGVGLAIVHRIVRRHGGRVWADGAVGEGATFFFTLPKAEVMLR